MTALVTTDTAFTLQEKQAVLEAVRVAFANANQADREAWYAAYELFNKVAAWSMYADEDA